MHNVILDASARAAFVCGWAQAEEEAGRAHGGKELMGVAPETPPEALEWAVALWTAIAKKNKDFCYVSEKDKLNLGAWMDSAWEDVAKQDGLKQYVFENAREFGHYIAMQAMGTGVRWSDSHEDHGLKIPYKEGPIVDLGEDDGEPRDNPDWKALGGKAKRAARAAHAGAKKGVAYTKAAAGSFAAGWRENPSRAFQPREHGLTPAELRTMEIQSLVFDCAAFTPQRAVCWAAKNGFEVEEDADGNVANIDENVSEGALYMQQKPTQWFEEGSFRTVQLKPGIRAIVGRFDAADEQ